MSNTQNLIRTVAALASQGYSNPRPVGTGGEFTLMSRPTDENDPNRTYLGKVQEVLIGPDGNTWVSPEPCLNIAADYAYIMEKLGFAGKYKGARGTDLAAMLIDQANTNAPTDFDILAEALMDKTERG